MTVDRKYRLEMKLQGCSQLCRSSLQALLFWFLLFTVVKLSYDNFKLTTNQSMISRAIKIILPEAWTSSRFNLTADINIWPDVAENPFNRKLNQTRFVEIYAQSTYGRVRSNKSILVIGNYFFNFGKAQQAFDTDKCPISACTITNDANRCGQTADAIVIFGSNSMAKFLPKPAHQLWIASHWESPAHNRINTVSVQQYINWSSSYRHDSHIVAPYGYVERLPSAPADSWPSSTQTTTRSRINYAAGKKKQVAWFVSNCHDRNGRRNYATELNRYIKVDIYGACGKAKCSHADICFEMLKKDYMFYLAFENSNCFYYMTEKLFRNALENNVIPIVMGARPQDYAASLPPHSYIHVDDFTSPRHLADYLHMLEANETLYSEYFLWKTDWKLDSHIPDWRLENHSYWCQLCGLLHFASEQNYVHWYANYTQWWDGDQSKSCGARWTEYNGVRWQTWRNAT